MKFATTIILAALYSSVYAAPVKRDVDPSLVPDLGFTAGINPTGTGDCDGAVNGADGKPIKIPCACPPDRATFVTAINRDIAAGHAVNNPTVKITFPADPNDQSKESKLARISAATVSLQNLHGPGQGCPVVSTTLQAQAQAIQNNQPSASPSAASPPTPAPPAANANQGTGASFNPSLVPDLGFQSGINPSGTGDCDGAVNDSNGKPIQIPCSCPPDRATFVAAMARDVAAGHAVNNPTVKVAFPTDNSKQSQLARITAASISLQNLAGPGKGCPITATTLQAQAEAIQNNQADTVPADDSSNDNSDDDTDLHQADTVPADDSSNDNSDDDADLDGASDDNPTVTVTVTAEVTATAVPSLQAIVQPQAPASTNGFDASLVPDLGFQAGLNPTGTGDCDGAVNGPDGKPIKIPCACPPDRATFVAAMARDVAAGRAVNNPTVKVTFPTDNSKQSKLARISAATVSLQNLNGPGKGCPIVSTTLQAQAKAIQNGP